MPRPFRGLVDFEAVPVIMAYLIMSSLTVCFVIISRLFFFFFFVSLARPCVYWGVVFGVFVYYL